MEPREHTHMDLHTHILPNNHEQQTHMHAKTTIDKDKIHTCNQMHPGTCK